MAFRVSRRQNVNAMSVVKRSLVLVMSLFVGSEILTKFAAAVQVTNTSIFASGLELLGMTTGSSGYLEFSSTGLLSILGIIAGAQLVLSFVKVSW